MSGSLRRNPGRSTSMDGAVAWTTWHYFGGKMNNVNRGAARAVADIAEGYILATVEVAAPVERVYRGLASSDIVAWWVGPGVFDTREWTGDLRVGGLWRASAMARARPYTPEGACVHIDAPRKPAPTSRL